MPENSKCGKRRVGREYTCATGRGGVEPFSLQELKASSVFKPSTAGGKVENSSCATPAAAWNIPSKRVETGSQLRLGEKEAERKCANGKKQCRATAVGVNSVLCGGFS